MEGILALGVGKSGQSWSQCTNTETIFTMCMNEFECCSYLPLGNHGCEYKDSIQPPIGYIRGRWSTHLIRLNPYLLTKSPCAHCSELTKEYIGTCKPISGILEYHCTLGLHFPLGEVMMMSYQMTPGHLDGNNQYHHSTSHCPIQDTNHITTS